MHILKTAKTASELEDTQPHKKVSEQVSNILEEAKQAALNHNLPHAHTLSLQATQIAPNDIPAWAMRIQLAPSLEEKILCMNRLNELKPNRRGNQDATYKYVSELLNQDPFLAYLEETSELYHVLNKDRILLSIPKGRVTEQPFPPEKADSLSSAYRWLALALFGLMFAGLPTLLFAPLAVFSTFKVQSSAHSSAHTVQCAVIQLAAILLFLVGVFFSLLFAIHLS
jgi:hypothetical protein